MKNVSILIALLLTQYSCWASQPPAPADQPPAHAEEVAPTYEDTILNEMVAAAHNGLPVLQEYLSSHAQYGITINFVDLDGNTALHRAVVMQDVDAIRTLIAAGINVNLITITKEPMIEEGVSALCLAAILGVPLIVQELLNAPRIKIAACSEITDFEETEMEMLAILELMRQAEHRQKTAKTRVRRKASEASSDQAKWQLNQQMYRIINSGDMRELEAFLKKHKGIVNYIHPDSGISYLMYVILAGPLLLVKDMGQESFPLDIPPLDKWPEFEKELRKRFPNVEVKLTHDAAGNTVLTLSVNDEHNEEHFKFIYSNYLEAIRILIRAGADVNARATDTEKDGTYGNRTALHVAALARRPEVIPLLIEAGADVNASADIDETYGAREATPFLDALMTWDCDDSPRETLVDTLRALLRAPTIVIDENTLKYIKKMQTNGRSQVKGILEQVLKSEGSEINPSARRVLEQVLAGASEESWVSWALRKARGLAGGLLTPAGSEGGAGPVIPGRKGAQQEMEERHLEREAYEYAKSHPGEKGKGKEKESTSPRRSPR